MENPIESFESQGLKLDKERVLTYSKLSCPLECTYCFAEEMSQEQSRKVAYLNEQQFELLQNLPEHIRLIMLGCDTEFFQNKQESLRILEILSTYGRDISVITKLSLPEGFVDALGEINVRMQENGNIFSFSISLPCLDESLLEKYEPRVPHPEKRIETLSSVFQRGIPTTTAIRPLLPDVSDHELEDIINKTKDYCFGYYSGPLYLKEDKVRILLPDYVSKIESELQPQWMLPGNSFQMVKRDGQMEFLSSLVQNSGREFFEGAADAIEFLRNKSKHEKS